MIVFRLFATLIGISILAAVAYVQIATTGGFAQPSAYLIIALPAGVAVGAIALGHAYSQRRPFAVMALALTMLAGESYGFLATAERSVYAREAMQTPLKSQLAEHDAAKTRLELTTTALKEANAEVLSSAADRGCRENCRILLQKQVDDAQAALVSARNDLAMHPLPASATPLADRLGIQPWQLDLVMAALYAIGANGLAASLLAYASHFRAPTHRTEKMTPATNVVAPSATSETKAPAALQAVEIIDDQRVQIVDGRPFARVDDFASQCLSVSEDARLDFNSAYAAYCSWADSNNERALPRLAFERAMIEICGMLGASIERRGRRSTAVNLQLVA
jgi:hypothetical protein